MMLVYDLRAMQILFHPPADAGSREHRTVTIARLIAMIGEEKRKALPKWKRYYLAHREKEIARQKAYRAAHPDNIRKYNRHYYRNRKQSKNDPVRTDLAHSGGGIMLDVIRDGWDRLVRSFFGGEEPETGTAPVLAESSPSRILVEPISITSESEPELQEEPVDLSRWNVTNYTESPFEKCGRLYIEDDDLVIRSDLDDRCFCIPLVDVAEVLDGETVPVLLLSNGTQVGAAKRSASGKAMNFLIEQFLYTSPLTRVLDVLDGRARKAAVFVGREEVEEKTLS